MSDLLSQQMTALVVDDSPLSLSYLEGLLLDQHYEVVTAGDGNEALAAIKAHRIDIVFLDLVMPGMSGFEVCEQIKKNPATKSIPVVLVSTLSEREDRIKGLDAGADEFLTKPVDEAELVSRCKTLLTSQQLDVKLTATSDRHRDLTERLYMTTKELDRLILKSVQELREGLDAVMMGAGDAAGCHKRCVELEQTLKQMIDGLQEELDTHAVTLE